MRPEALPPPNFNYPHYEHGQHGPQAQPGTGYPPYQPGYDQATYRPANGYPPQYPGYGYPHQPPGYPAQAYPHPGPYPAGTLPVHTSAQYTHSNDRTNGCLDTLTTGTTTADVATTELDAFLTTDPGLFAS